MMMGVRVVKAMVELRAAFKHRSKPRTIGHCRMCYDERDIQQFLSLDPVRMGEQEFRPILWDGCRCFGCWEELAYYIPWLLDICFNDWYVGGQDFLSMLVRALEEETMCPEERDAILAAMRAHLEEAMEQSEGDSSCYIDETIACLGAFDGSLAPLFAHLGVSEHPQVRANYCLFVAKQALLQPKRKKMPPRNQKAFDALLEPSESLSVLF
ncbi:hypothetical protein CCAX7_12000 [Capsulimonas corticalis]|uniref:Uncharacterized protein n=1 Tax=Capsulimonas corticalis TaxID=2219043 RepID=A0A402D4N2_9BACT|nr:hypothetical protein [Capsulimonas corticalis]BDI29149.1 hypothetical protein CCAX7_12000 [Capsulimonas corticalis]